ncbi:C4-dicarboxylate ABC transporter [Alicyclobacillus fastidiosus]|uniref:C4-dicarboxylate ABC transporter n=1 Tax=Alicyclobacillus fastidiosus TaxID=392011 RepID=A0ABY6ZIH9_9BACL|nr:C4-dicarboxylate ABC transporter [Alicyclobacillus fastidiosus]WAH42684.1 C4-dicarboxylate ABC transporter [Alicyclobacillus fastidiosus]
MSIHFGRGDTVYLAKQFGPNWFTTVMGIGIVAALTYSSPFRFSSQHAIGIAIFFGLNTLFIVAITLWTSRWILFPNEALEDFRHPERALFYGALAMGVNVVGNDWFVIGSHVFQPSLVIDVSKTVWVVGAILSVLTAVVVPYLLFTEHQVTTKDTLASWLIPVVPPIVAAATGSNLIPYWGGAQVQFCITAVILAMFGMTFFLFIMVSTLFYARLVYHRRLGGAVVPSLWVEIGPIGMSMATLATLPTQTRAILPQYSHLLEGLATVTSMALWGVGIWWIVIAAMHTMFHLRKRGNGIPFNMGWWSYVFPIGSFTSGTYALGHLLRYDFFVIAGFVQLLILWGCFAIVLARTIGGVLDGSLIQWKEPAGAFLQNEHEEHTDLHHARG